MNISGSYCGDAMQNGSEACDDGNAIETDTCKSDCSLTICGDGIT
jgi:cysteine-rich repeat protein